MKTEITEIEEQERQAILNEVLNVVAQKNPDIERCVEYIQNIVANLRKPSEPEPIGRTDEELVKEIEDIMYSYAAPLPASGLQVIFLDSVNKIATDIPKIIPSSRCQENDVNVELLNTLKMIKELNGGDMTGNETWFLAQQAITNYEKQMKP